MNKFSVNMWGQQNIFHIVPHETKLNAVGSLVVKFQPKHLINDAKTEFSKASIDVIYLLRCAHKYAAIFYEIQGTFYDWIILTFIFSCIVPLMFGNPEFIKILNHWSNIYIHLLRKFKYCCIEDSLQTYSTYSICKQKESCSTQC